MAWTFSDDINRPVDIGSLIDELYKAIHGQYHVILDLMSVIDTGPTCKRLLDEIINRCDAVVNLREAILMHRVEHSVHGDFSSIEKGIGCLERYFSLLAFTSYVNEALASAIATSSKVPFGNEPLS